MWQNKVTASQHNKADDVPYLEEGREEHNSANNTTEPMTFPTWQKVGNEHNSDNTTKPMTFPTWKKVGKNTTAPTTQQSQ